MNPFAFAFDFAGLNDFRHSAIYAGFNGLLRMIWSKDARGAFFSIAGGRPFSMAALLFPLPWPYRFEFVEFQHREFRGFIADKCLD